MRVSQVDLSERSRRFWTHAFTQGRSEGFGFLEQVKRHSINDVTRIGVRKFTKLKFYDREKK
jgi:hypothetical protein